MSSSVSRRRAAGAVGLMTGLVVLLAGCGSSGDAATSPAAAPVPTDAPASSGSSSPSSSAAGSSAVGSSAAGSSAAGSSTVGSSAVGSSSGGVTATDPKGKAVTLAAPATRVVCLTGLCDDVLFTLGLRPVATSTPDLLALPEYLGEEARTITAVPGGFGSEDIETIAAAEPELIIGLAGVHDQQRAALENYAPLVAIDVSTYRDSLAYQDFLGTLTGREQQAADGRAAFEKTHADLLARGKAAGLDKVTALSMYWNVGTTGVNTSEDIIGSLLGEVFAYPWPSKGGDYTTQAVYAVDEILKKDPQFIFMQSWTAGPDAPTGSQEMAKNPLWKRITAVKQDQVEEVTVTLWTAGRGPYALSLVLQQAVDAATGTTS